MCLDTYRGGRSHIEQDEFLIALGGSFEVVVDNGAERKTFFNKPNIGLHIPLGIWRELSNFSLGSISLVLNSDFF